LREITEFRQVSGKCVIRDTAMFMFREIRGKGGGWEDVATIWQVHVERKRKEKEKEK